MRQVDAEHVEAGVGQRLRQEAAAAAPDVVSLLRLLRADLTPKLDFAQVMALYACDVRPEIWEAVEARSEDAGTRLVAPPSPS